MKTTTSKKWLSAALCLTLAAGLAACSKEPEVPSSSEPISSQAVSSEPVSSEPESSWFVPAPDLIPDGPGEGAEGFEAAFSQNPIDKAYDAAYEEATTFSMMRRACDDAAASWKAMVKTAYQAAAQTMSEEEQTTLRQEQDSWDHDLNRKITEIEEKAGDGNQGILEAARQTVLLYRQRVKELCQIKYEADGELPEFPGSSGEAGE